jgi:site-specific recombinase XerD
MNPTLSHLITHFFVSHLKAECGASENTVAAYSDTLRLLIGHLCEKHSKHPEEITSEMITQEEILGFLNHLEHKRNNCPATRNQRLAAIKSFLHYAARENPGLMLQNERTQAIRSKKTEHTPPPSLGTGQVRAILEAVDASTLIGKRDKALIQLLYNTGARVQEIADLRIGDLDMEGAATVRLTGKGKKMRIIPLWDETVQCIKAYLQARVEKGICSEHLLLNSKGAPLTRFGIGRRIELHAKNAAKSCPSLTGLKVTPHVFRHTTALHLIESDNDITIVKDWLGHADIQTTNLYVEVSVARKQRALEKLPPPGTQEPPRKPKWKAPGILEFLASLSGNSPLCCNLPVQTLTADCTNADFAT